jgi:thioester reductase-like protein
MKNKNIFITGATGFVGKVFLNKILTNYPHIGTIYLHVRPKTGIPPMDRLNNLISQSMAFNGLRNEKKDYIKSKVHLIEGDLLQPNIGLSNTDYNLLRENINIIINLGANVSWKESINQILSSNLSSLKDIIKLSKDINVEHLVHISTMGVPFIKNRVETNLGKHFDFEEYTKRLESMDLKAIENESERIQKLFGNTYTFAKLGSERLIEQYRGGLTTTIIRGPSIGSALYNPAQGWLDTLTGYSGNYFYLATSKALAYLINKRVVLNEYPVDIFANYIAAITVDGLDSKQHKIYNIPPLDTLSLFDAMKTAENYYYNHPIPGIKYIKPVYFDNSEDYNNFIKEQLDKPLDEQQRHMLEKTIYFNTLYRFANNELVITDDTDIDFTEAERLKNRLGQEFNLTPKDFSYKNYVESSCQGISKYYLKFE